MHRPPAVSHTVGRSPWQLGVIAALAGLALLAATQLALVNSVSGVRWASFLVAALCLAFALTGWAHSPCGKLQWDGQHWLWSGFAETPVRQTLSVLDFQSVMLLKVTSDLGDVVWLWLHGRMDEAKWRSLRRAVVARQTPHAAPDSPSREAGAGSSP